MSKKMLVKFKESGFYNIRGKATDVKGLEFPLVEDWKKGADLVGYVTVDGSYQPGFPTRNIRIKCDQNAFTLIDESKAAVKAEETDEQIIERLRKRFDILEDMTQATKEGTVRGTGVCTMKTVDDVNTLFVGLQGFNRLRQFRFGQRSTASHACWDRSTGLKALVLHEEDHTFGAATIGDQLVCGIRNAR